MVEDAVLYLIVTVEGSQFAVNVITEVDGGSGFARHDGQYAGQRTLPACRDYVHLQVR